MKYNFCATILSHGRSDRVWTFDTLRKCGYTGDIIILVDNEDKTICDYRRRFGDSVVVFDKSAESVHSDAMCQRTNLNIVLFARNVCHKIVADLGYEYFVMLDDDYVNFRRRFVDNDGVLRSQKVTNLDALFDCTIDFLVCSNATSIAWAQTGDLIAGKNSNMFKNRITRKAMNVFFCSVKKPFKFLGSLNEDVNAYCLLGSQGDLFFTVADICVDQTTTQQNKGGLTEAYLNLGTYVKSFYSVMCCPSFVKVLTMGWREQRFHHRISWNNAVPKIISSEYKRRMVYADRDENIAGNLR